MNLKELNEQACAFQSTTKPTQLLLQNSFDYDMRTVMCDL